MRLPVRSDVQATTHVVGNPGLGLGQPQNCGEVVLIGRSI